MTKEDKNKASLSHRCLKLKERVKKCRRPRRSPSLTASGTKRKGKKGRAKKKKAGRKDDQALADKEEGKKKKIRSFARKRGRHKGRCELSEEREEKEKEGEHWRKLKAESAENESISDNEL